MEQIQQVTAQQLLTASALLVRNHLVMLKLLHALEHVELN